MDSELKVGDRAWAAFVSSHNGMSVYCTPCEIAAVLEGKVLAYYAFLPSGERIAGPATGYDFIRYFPTERAARFWAAGELRRLADDFSADAEKLASTQEEIAAKEVVTV